MKIIKATATNMNYRHGKFTSGKSIKLNNIYLHNVCVATVVSDAVSTLRQKKEQHTENATTTIHCINFYVFFLF